MKSIIGLVMNILLLQISTSHALVSVPRSTPASSHSTSTQTISFPVHPQVAYTRTCLTSKGLHSLRLLLTNLNVGVDHSMSRLEPSLGSRPFIGKSRNLDLRKAFQVRGGWKLNYSPAAELATLSEGSRRMMHSMGSSPEAFFNACFVALFGISLIGKFGIPLLRKSSSSTGQGNEQTIDSKPAAVKSLQLRFLVVFWLLRMADWLQGPYFYEVYSSKIINNLPVSLDLVSKLFLVGFATTGVFGPILGKLVDKRGRKLGTLLYAALYTLGALSTQSSTLLLLLLGRIAGGLGTSLLFSAPESWMVGEHMNSGFDGRWLGETFGWAYSGDALVAIAAGQIASMAASKFGPSGPFTTSIAFLAVGSLIAAWQWKENVATASAPAEAPTDQASIPTEASGKKEKPDSIGDAWSVMKSDKKILLIGAVQAFFEGAMYIFVLQWPPAIKAAVQALAGGWGAVANVPYGKIFSCFMASCLLGSSIFGALQSRGVAGEKIMSAMLLLATGAMATSASLATPSIGILAAAFFLFEVCVGIYFPSIGTLRSKYIPDSHRSIIMNLFGIPLNLIVVSVFLSIRKLGVQGALACSTVSLSVATICMLALSALTNTVQPSKTESLLDAAVTSSGTANA